MSGIIPDDYTVKADVKIKIDLLNAFWLTIVVLSAGVIFKKI